MSLQAWHRRVSASCCCRNPANSGRATPRRIRLPGQTLSRISSLACLFVTETVSAVGFHRAGIIVEPHVLGAPGEGDDAGGAGAVFGDDDFGLAGAVV